MNRDDELARFKTDINFIEYAESLGYEIDGKESSRASAVMRRGDDKIVVATDADGHGIYFSVKDDADNGSIIDFVQNRSGLNLGQVRKELRPWTGNTPASYRPKAPQAQRAKPVATTADRQRVLGSWMHMQLIEGKHAYLENERGISSAILADGRFAAMIRQDSKANAIFPHYDNEGLSGYEMKNLRFTGFSTGGKKSIWRSANVNDADQIIIVESAIDALSHAQITNGQSAYVSTGGSMSDYQCDTMRVLLATAASRGAVIVIGTDNDEPGQILGQQIQALVPAGAKVEYQIPKSGKDWNDQLLHASRKLDQARGMRM